MIQFNSIKPSLGCSSWINWLICCALAKLKRQWQKWSTSYVWDRWACSKLEYGRLNWIVLQSSLEPGELRHTLTGSEHREQRKGAHFECMVEFMVLHLWAQTDHFQHPLDGSQTLQEAVVPHPPLQQCMQCCKPATSAERRHGCYKPWSSMRIRRQESQSCLSGQHRTSVRCTRVTITVSSGSGRAAEYGEPVGKVLA